VADGAPQAAVKKRMLRIASGCATRDAFVSVFKRFCDRDSIFIATKTPKPAGAGLQFAITLSDGAPLIGGAGTVLESWSDDSSPYGRAGMRIRFDDVSPAGRALIDELVAARKSEEHSAPAIPISSAAAALAALAKAGPPPVATPPRTIKPLPSVIPKPSEVHNKTMLGLPPLKRPPKLEATPAPVAMREIARDVEVKLPPPPRAGRPTPTDTDEQPTGVAARFTPETAFPDEASWDEAASHVLGETRVKGSDVILPANPLGGVESESLDAFVECTLYEETGSFAIDTEATRPGGDPDDWAGDDLTIPPWLQGPAPEGLPPVDSMAVPPPPLPLEPPPRRPTTDRPSKSDLRAHLVDAGKAFDPARVPASEPILRARSRGHWPVTIAIAAVAGLVGVAIGYFALGRNGADEQGAPADDPPAVASTAEPAPPSDVIATRPAAAPEPQAAPEPTAAKDENKENEEQKETEPPPEVKEPDQPAEPPPATEPVEFARLDGKLGKDRCGVEIKSRPDGADVFIGETRLGQTPLRVVLPCGAQTVALRRPRYADLAKSIELGAGKLEKLEEQMSRPEHRLRVTSIPSGAEVKVNGRAAGTTPATVTVSGFETARVSVSLAGYKSWSGKVYSRESTTTVSAKLSADKPAPADKPTVRPGKSTARRGGD
jgi:hypothetical protein